MSMILSLKQAPAETLDMLVARPELAVVFWMDPDYVPAKPPALVRWLARFLGGYTPPMELPEPPAELARNGEVLRLESHTKRFATALGGAPGRALVGADHGHGDERAVWPGDVAAIGERLRSAASEPADDDTPRLLKKIDEYLQSTLAESLGLVIKIS